MVKGGLSGAWLLNTRLSEGIITNIRFLKRNKKTFKMDEKMNLKIFSAFLLNFAYFIVIKWGNVVEFTI